MCQYGTTKILDHPNITNSITGKHKIVLIDSCIYDEIKYLNDKGIKTLGCCCGHGKAGQNVEIKNDYGVWKTKHLPPHALVDENSIDLVTELGYRPIPYYDSNDEYTNAYMIFLKTGCITEKDIEEWNLKNEGINSLINYLVCFSL